MLLIFPFVSPSIFHIKYYLKKKPPGRSNFLFDEMAYNRALNELNDFLTQQKEKKVCQNSLIQH